MESIAQKLAGLDEEGVLALVAAEMEAGADPLAVVRDHDPGLRPATAGDPAAHGSVWAHARGAQAPRLARGWCPVAPAKPTGGGAMWSTRQATRYPISQTRCALIR